MNRSGALAEIDLAKNGIADIIVETQNRLQDAETSDAAGVRQILRSALDRLDAHARRTIGSGSFVSFTSKSGKRLTGTVVSVNTKSVTVSVAAPPESVGQMWRVLASALTVVDTIDVPTVGKEEASRLACVACAEPPKWGADECEAIHLVERAGIHLVFVETPAHGYFIAVFPSGAARVVGEEDEGIADAFARRHFGVDRYGRPYMKWVEPV